MEVRVYKTAVKVKRGKEDPHMQEINYLNEKEVNHISKTMIVTGVIVARFFLSQRFVTGASK